MKGFHFRLCVWPVVPTPRWPLRSWLSFSSQWRGTSAFLHQHELGHCRGTRLLKGALRHAGPCLLCPVAHPRGRASEAEPHGPPYLASLRLHRSSVMWPARSRRERINLGTKREGGKERSSSLAAAAPRQVSECAVGHAGERPCPNSLLAGKKGVLALARKEAKGYPEMGVGGAGRCGRVALPSMEKWGLWAGFVSSLLSLKSKAGQVGQTMPHGQWQQ